MTNQTTTSDVEKLGELIKGIKIAMLTTVDADGTLRARPMATQNEDFDGRFLWFFTSADAPKVDDVQRERDVNLSYADPGENRYVSVSGKALLVRDPATMERFWQPLLKAYFPDGLDTPDIGLLQVRVEKAEYWDAPSGKFVALVGFLKAIATGQRYAGEGADNQKLDLKQ
jgi:general stress protein 26